MNRILCLPVLFAALAAAPAAGDAARENLVGEILKRVPDWPGAQVEMPVTVYERLIREILAGPLPPKPPAATWIERATWTVRIGESETVVAPVFEVVSLPGVPPQPVRLLPTTIVWGDTTVDDRKIDLRGAGDGWFYFDPRESGRFRVSALTSIKSEPPRDSSRGAPSDGRRLAFPAAKAAIALATVESDGAWEVRFEGSPLTIVGTEKGTRGTVGLMPGADLEAVWRRPQPPLHRAAHVEAESNVGWTLADGVHQVHAILRLRLWGGETEELTVALPPGADRVKVIGPDVREVQVRGGSARVFLRGAITQRTLLNVYFELPRSSRPRRRHRSSNRQPRPSPMRPLPRPALRP